MSTRRELLEAIAAWPHEMNVTTAFMQLLDRYKVRRPTPQWLMEVYYFEKFRRNYEKLPEGSICYGDKPDVILAGKRKIGIEITNFYHAAGNLTESEQVQGLWREKAVSDAQQIYLANGGKGIELSFSFDKARPIQDRQRLAKDIAELASRIEGFPAGSINKGDFDHIPELSDAYLYHPGESQEARWRVLQLHDGRIMSRDKLLAIANDKEAKSAEYRCCDAYWLLVVVDYINSAQDQEIRVDGFEKMHSTVFEKVLVYETRYGHVLEASG